MRNIDGIHEVPLLAPVSITSATSSDVVGLKKYQSAKLLVMCGALAVDLTITVTKATSTTASGTDIAFKYRETSAVGTDSMGAYADALSTGHVLTATTDNNITTEILIDGADLAPVSGTEYPYVFVTLTPASASACLVAVMAILEPRYNQATPPSAVT